ncbi:hypothetical protein B1L04_20290 [Microcystis aeruginosa KW]|uniref:CHAT domain-containing protein n=1 Tax=Microcystis aeruginosa KW TaxID=1960155 RepID=A0A1V4BLH4_MICAE|nr:tetratricopeptide repeat protein [Microcystis aeruginosa]OPF14932.1 hypothetical protein B1L04_20290 [Microcystis aeruginosa KW]
MNPKFYALLTLSLVATVTLPVVNGKLSSLVPAVIAQNTNARKAEADRLNERGIQLLLVEVKMKSSVVIAQTIENQAVEAEQLYQESGKQFYLGRTQKALEMLEQALYLYIKIGNRTREGETLTNIGFVYGSISQYRKALEFYQRALVISREVGNRLGESTTLNNIGFAYGNLAQYREALTFFQQALAISREISDRNGEGIAFSNIGLIYNYLGQYQSARESYQKALNIRRELGDKLGEAITLTNLGLLSENLGDYKSALQFYEQALTLSREIDDKSIETTTLNNIGNIYSDIGLNQEALKSYQQVLAICRDIGNSCSMEGTILTNIGLYYDNQGQYQEALKFYQQSLDIRIKSGDKRGKGITLNNIGVVYRKINQYQKALEFHQQALAIRREIGDRAGESASLNNLGIVYRDTNQPSEAIKNLEASLKIILDMRGGLSRDDRKQFLATNEGTVITLAEVLIQQNQPEKAFEWLNLATTADLADYNRLIDAKVADLDAQKALDNWNTDNQQLEGMRRQLQDKYSEELAKDIRQFEEKVYKNAETIGQKYPEIAELFESKPTDIAQLQKNIAPDTLVIQPVLLGNKATLFLITRDKLTVIQSDAKRDELNKLVSEYRTQLADYKNADYLVTGSKLYEILIRSIESQIATSSPKNIAIIASGQLRYIPFETLYDKKNKQVLLEKYPIYYLTRISTSTPPATERKPLQGLAFANPKPTQKELKGTEIEAETISKLFPRSEKYLGTNATLDIFKKQAFRFSILHLGTHGCFKRAGCPNLDMQANTILFANKEQYNIADAALLGLKNTELITLSACQTAKEANADGQEISGLAYVLERAGAKSVIASLWDAEDNTSAEIMTQFYQNLKNGMTKSEAMRQAKLSQIKSHPFFWSPFILIGAAN